MPAQVLTNVDLGSIALGDEVHRDELITFGGAATLLAGCIMARDSVSLKLVPFVKGGSTNQNGIPKAVLTYPSTATGAGDLKERVLVSGKVNKNRLVINADGNGTNIDGAVLDQLRAFGITPVDVQQLST
jgi:hypothetical protein